MKRANNQLLSDIKDRLLSYRVIEDTTGCWLFTRAISSNGYGIISFKNKRYSTHRLSAHLFLGLDLESKLYANHKNICPNRRCFNPEHLYIGTHNSNMSDMREKNSCCGICGNKYDGIKVRQNGRIDRKCMNCSRRYIRESQARRKRK